MGVDFSYGDAHFGHGSFHSLCKTLAAMLGVRLGEMQGFGGQVPWETVADPIAPLLWRNDAGGELTPVEARDAAARLEELMASSGTGSRSRATSGRTCWPG